MRWITLLFAADSAERTPDRSPILFELTRSLIAIGLCPGLSSFGPVSPSAYVWLRRDKLNQRSPAVFAHRRGKSRQVSDNQRLETTIPSRVIPGLVLHRWPNRNDHAATSPVAGVKRKKTEPACNPVSFPRF